MIIDHQAHWYPKAFLDALGARREPPRVVKRQKRMYFEPYPGVTVPIPELFWNLDLRVSADDSSRARRRGAVAPDGSALSW
jgi:hypothetical protein